MSLDFPASPTEGQTYTAEGALYRFTNDRWVILAQNGALSPGWGAGLPTSSAGLDTGTLWNDAGTVKVA